MLKKKFFLGAWLGLASVTGAQYSLAASTAGEMVDQTTNLSEIVVTAEKREERLQDVPVPVTAISAQTLVDTNQVSIRDYYSSIPSLNYTPSDNGSGSFVIRGLTSGIGNPTVSVMIDGIPFGSASVIGNSGAIPDLDPGDLDRIEVLRGPQGTLYGASSIGGLINFVTRAPSTDALSGRMQADMNSVYGGNGPGYGWRGEINVPLSDTLAVRASAFARHDTGYIDNVQTGQTGVNWVNADGGRLSTLWKPTDAFSLQLGALLQNSTLHGDPQVYLAPGFGDLQQSDVRGAGWSHQNSQDYTAVAKAKVGTFDVTSASAYNVNSQSINYDFSPAFGAVTLPLYGTTGDTTPGYNSNHKFTEELRLSTPIGTRVEWLVGAFYTHEHTPTLELNVPVNVATGASVGTFANFFWWTTFTEYAGFTDLTVHFTDQFDVQFGGRESFNKQRYGEVDSGLYVPTFEGLPSPAVYPIENTSQNSFTYLVTPRFKFSEDLMVYARLASGYRPGGPNFNDVGKLAAEVPAAFGADKTKNYEIGVKGDVFNRAFTFDASLYYIDWKNIQLFLINPISQLGYFGNAGGAKSQGLEVTVESRPLPGLTLGAWVSFNESELTVGFPTDSSAYGVPGNPLPFSSRFSGNASVQQEFPLTGRVTGVVGAAVSYIGQRFGTFLGAPPSANPRQEYPAYAKADLHAGAKYDDWTFNLFANNVTDRRGILNGGAGTSNPESFYIVTPRTLGLSVARSF